MTAVALLCSCGVSMPEGSFFRHMSRRGCLGRTLISPQAVGRANGVCEISSIGHVVQRPADRGVSGSSDPYADIGMLRPKRDQPFGFITHRCRKPNPKYVEIVQYTEPTSR